MGLAYLHVLRTPPLPNIFDVLRPLYSGTFAAGGAFDFASGNAAIASGTGRLHRVRQAVHVEPGPAGAVRGGLELTPFDATTFYTPGAKGYTDYLPASAQSA